MIATISSVPSDEQHRGPVNDVVKRRQCRHQPRFDIVVEQAGRGTERHASL